MVETHKLLILFISLNSDFSQNCKFISYKLAITVQLLTVVR